SDLVDVVGAAGRLQAVEQPETLLGEGERRAASRGVAPADRLVLSGRPPLGDQPVEQQLLLAGGELRDARRHANHAGWTTQCFFGRRASSTGGGRSFIRFTNSARLQASRSLKE